MNKVYLSLSLCLSTLLAGVIDEGFSYQDYLDFGQNKGRFKAGAKNLYLLENKNGQITKHPFDPSLHMPDLIGAVDKERGDVTIINGPYVLSSHHVMPGKGRKFSDYGTQYHIIDALTTGSLWTGDAGVYRTQKFITGLTPPEGFLTSDEKDKFAQKGRYTQAWRAGAGIAYYKSTANYIGWSYQARIGGRLSGPSVKLDKAGLRFHIFRNDWEGGGPPWIPQSAITTSGDSGTPIFLYDSVEHKWVVAGTVSAGNAWSLDVYALVKFDLLKILNQKYATTPISLSSSPTFWTEEGINQTSLENKDLYLQNGGILTLQADVNQGVGGIYFQGNQDTHYTIESENNANPHSWQGGGLNISEGATVHWKVKGIKGQLVNPNRPDSDYTTNPDSLHKIGKGTLSVEVENGGWLNLGEGKVILDTQTNAFEKILLTSGRGTLQLLPNKSSALDTEELYFIFRGGTLDVNGNDLTFESVINHNDNGAKIINTSKNRATITINKHFLNAYKLLIPGSGTFMYHGDIGDNIKIYKNGADQPECGESEFICQTGYGENLLAFDGEILNPRGELEHINGKLVLQGHPVIHAYLDPNNKGQNEHLQNIKKLTGEEVFTTPTTLEQEDWETRRFILNKLTLSKTDELTEGKPQSSTFVLGRNALLFTDLFTNQTEVYFGGKQDLYIDRYDGENILVDPHKKTKNKKFYTFKQTLTKGPSQKDDSFYFEGNITGSNASSFYISNTADNPLRFGSFVGFDRSDITLQKRANVNYKVSLDSSSRFYAKHIELWGNGESEAILDFKAVKNASFNTSKENNNHKNTLVNNTITHLVLKGNHSSLVRGDLNIGSIDTLRNTKTSPNTNSSITFTSLDSKLRVNDGTLSLDTYTSLIYDGGLNVFDLYYNTKYPLILTSNKIQDLRNQKDIIFNKTNLLDFAPIETYNEDREIGLIIRRDISDIPIPPTIQSNPMFNALTQTNAEKTEQFYEVAFNELTNEAHRGNTELMAQLLHQAETLTSNLSNASLPLFTLSSIASSNYAKNLKLYLESKTGFSQKISLGERLRVQAFLAKHSYNKDVHHSSYALASNAYSPIYSSFAINEEVSDIYPNTQDIVMQGLEEQQIQKENQENQFLEQKQQFQQSLQPQTLQEESIQSFQSIQPLTLDKNHNLWIALNSNYAMAHSSSIFGGGVNGGYDYLFSTSSLFASFGLSLNYSYASYKQEELLTSNHSVLLGLHSDLIFSDTHELMSNILVGGGFNTLSAVHSHLVPSFMGGFPLRESGSVSKQVGDLDSSKDFLSHLQIFYKYIFTLTSSDEKEAKVQEIKPVLGVEYGYLDLGASGIDVFKIERLKLHLPTLKAGIEYSVANAKEVHIFSLLAGYSFNIPKERIVNVGTASYKDTPYIQSRIQKANLLALYTGSIDVGHSLRVDYSLKARSSLLELGYFEVGGNVGVSWRF